MLSDSHIYPTLPASDYERAKSFYSEKLGLKPVREIDFGGGAFYESGETTFFLYPSPFAGTNEATAASWAVTDIEGVVAGLKAAGVEFQEYDLENFKTVDGIATTPDGSRGAWFKDSEGNILSVFQEAG